LEPKRELLPLLEEDGANGVGVVVPNKDGVAEGAGVVDFGAPKPPKIEP
jgi:hypothetical protein